MSWRYDDIRDEINIEVTRPGHNPGRVLVSPDARGLLTRTLRTALRDSYRVSLQTKKSQGKTSMVTARCPPSNHFMATGRYTRFCDWRFIHRARLDVLLLHGNRRWGDGLRPCRVCLYPFETIPYVVNHCMKHSKAIQHRHDAVLDRLVEAILEHTFEHCEVQINRRPRAMVICNMYDLI